MVLLCVNDYAQEFKLKKKHNQRLFNNFKFEKLNIKTILYYSVYIGIADAQQREFSLIFMRLLPIFQAPKGYIEFDITTNNLIVYIKGFEPVVIAVAKNMDTHNTKKNSITL